MGKLSKPTFRADIQALRALAVSYVVVGHLWPKSFSGGYVGVDVFFVISGFLITSHLIARAEKDGYGSLIRFWGNRAIRILPAAVLVLAFCVVLTVLVVPVIFWKQFFREILGATIYIENWVLAIDAADYWAADNSASPVRHYWSLSVEEQFYIFMPLVLVASLQSANKWRTWYLSGLALIVVASFVYSIWFTGYDSSAAYFVTATRVWEFALGSLLALTIRTIPSPLDAVLAWSGLIMIIFAGIAFSEQTAFPGYKAALPVVGTLLVILANVETGKLGSFFKIRPFQFIGDISYAIYLWHWPIIIFASFIWLDQVSFAHRLTMMTLSIVLAWLSTRFFEDPIRYRLAKKTAGRRVVLVSITIGMIGLTIVSAHLMGMGVRNSALPSQQEDNLEKPTSPCFGAQALFMPDCPPAAVMKPSVFEFTNDDGNRRGCWATQGVTDPKYCTLGSSDSPSLRVAAIGDSHNNSLIPAYAYIAKEFGWSLDVFGKNGCYLTNADLYPESQSKRQDCMEWREKLNNLLARLDPYDLIIVAFREVWILPGTNLSFEDEVNGMVDAWSAQIDRGTKIIALTDIPKYRNDIVECIAKHELEAENNCSTPESLAFREVDSKIAAAAKLDDAIAIDTRRYYCTESDCPALVGGVPVVFNRNHTSGTYAKTLGPILAEDVRQAMKNLD